MEAGMRSLIFLICLSTSALAQDHETECIKGETFINCQEFFAMRDAELKNDDALVILMDENDWAVNIKRRKLTQPETDKRKGDRPQ
jgi:hypothetical protein